MKQKQRLRTAKVFRRVFLHFSAVSAIMEATIIYGRYTQLMKKRVFLIVLDSFGCGELPDAASFGDCGSHTLRSLVQSGRHTANAPSVPAARIPQPDTGKSQG